MQVQPSARKEIRNLIAVLIAGLVSAGLLTWGMIYTYGPSGSHFARNVLLSPEMMTISFPDVNSRSGEVDHFIFEGMEFSYRDPTMDKMIHRSIPIDLYEQFYHKIGAEKSLQNVSEDIKTDFGRSNPSTLVLKVKSNTSSQVFQEVHFLPKDYYRIQLRQQGASDSWAYYYHPHIYDEVMQLFAGRS